MRKVMLSVAPVSAADTYNDPEAIARDVVKCYYNGAAMVHLHVRDENGQLTPDLTRLQKTVELIRRECDIIIEISTGGVSNLTIEERCQPCQAPYAEALSLNVGSVNLGEAVYRNPIGEVRYCVEQILASQKIPEVEVFELGMIHTVRKLDEAYHFVKPILFALVFGHGGEMPATPAALRHMREYLYECFPETGSVLWGYTEAHRKDWEMVALALQQGASAVRIGFEDSDYLDPEHRVKENAELIRKCAEVLRENGCEPMTPEEARKMLRISKK